MTIIITEDTLKDNQLYWSGRGNEFGYGYECGYGSGYGSENGDGSGCGYATN